MVYITYLVGYKKKIFKENFIQSDNGPVFIDIYNKYDKYQDQKITSIPEKPTFGSNFQMFLIKISRTYIKKTDKDLTVKLITKND
jgi:uncharacterized phage-associated protein